MPPREVELEEGPLPLFTLPFTGVSTGLNLLCFNNVGGPDDEPTLPVVGEDLPLPLGCVLAAVLTGEDFPLAKLLRQCPCVYSA